MAEQQSITLVKQEDPAGCFVASMAMILGKTYKEVKKDFHNDFSEEGVNTNHIIDYLGDHGFSVIFKKMTCYNEKNFGRKEMLKPFAPVHLLVVQSKFDSGCHHAVVMDAKGKLYCPSGKTHKETRDSYIIHEVFGLFK
jgi:hypothetical protein